MKYGFFLFLHYVLNHLDDRLALTRFIMSLSLFSDSELESHTGSTSLMDYSDKSLPNLEDGGLVVTEVYDFAFLTHQFRSFQCL